MATINFKSVGERTSVLLDEIVIPDPTPVGIMTPMRLGTRAGGLFGMYTSLQKTLNDNLRNLLLTNHGERLVFYDFGANLRSLLMSYTEMDQESFDAEAAIRIKTSVSKYMPFLSLETFESRVDHSHNKDAATVIIRIGYSIPRLGVKDLAQEVVLVVGG